MVCWMCSLNKDYSKLYDTLFLSSKREYQYDYSIEVDNKYNSPQKFWDYHVTK